jgi:hypothetical protein
MDSYDYKSTMIAVPTNYSVPLHNLSGGGDKNESKEENNNMNKTLPIKKNAYFNAFNIGIDSESESKENNSESKEGDNELKENNSINKPVLSKNNTSSEKKSESKEENDNMNITLPKKDNAFFESFNISLGEKKEPRTIRDYNIGGNKYYLYDISNASQIDLSDANIISFVNDFYLNILEPEKQREFIFALLKCENMNSIVQGITCDPLITQIGFLIEKINASFSNTLKNLNANSIKEDDIIEEEKPAESISAIEEKKEVIEEKPAESISAIEEKKEVIEEKKHVEASSVIEETLNKIDYNVQTVSGDGWCLYRAMIQGLARLRDPSANHIRNWYEYENTKIKELMPELVKKMKESLDDKYIASLSFNSNQNANPSQNFNGTFRKYIADYIIQRPAETKNVKTVDEYINLLNVYENNNFINGPSIWGDALISGYIFSKMNHIILNTYQQCAGAKDIPDCENKYKLFITSKEYIDPTINDHINILYNGVNHYNLLVKKSIQAGGKRFLKARLHK